MDDDKLTAAIYAGARVTSGEAAPEQFIQNYEHMLELLRTRKRARQDKEQRR